jgi:hypothetical protein
MSTEHKVNENIRWLLARIQEASEAIESDEIEYDLDEFSKLEDAPPVSLQRQMIYNLHDKGLIKILKEIYNTYGEEKLRAVGGGGFEIQPLGFILKILRQKFDQYLRDRYKVKKEGNDYIFSTGSLQVESTKDEHVRETEFRVITKNRNGFFFTGNTIDFGQGTQYGDLFDIIFSNCVQSGFVSYGKINEELLKRGWKEVPPKKIKKRIQNAITNGIFRFTKISGKKFQNMNPFNKEELIKLRRGRGVEFNNYR